MIQISLELLVGDDNVFSGVLEVNATNFKGLTAMDVLDIVMEDPSDIHIRKILQNAMAIEFQEASNPAHLPSFPKEVSKNKPSSLHDLTEEPLKDWFKYFKFQLQRDSSSDRHSKYTAGGSSIDCHGHFPGRSEPGRGLATT